MSVRRRTAPAVPAAAVRAAALLGALAALLAAAALPASAGAAATGTYIVRMKAAPVASYAGGRAGYKATSPRATGARRLYARSRAARAYRSFLVRRQRSLVRRLPGRAPRVIHRYGTAFSGFAAELTARQAAWLRRSAQVARVWADRTDELQQAPDLDDVTSVNALLDDPTGFGDSAAYLDLPEGIWNDLGGPDQAAEDVIVGVIDSGITPQHPSFADTAAAGFLGPDYGPVPARWGGTCAVSGDPIAPEPERFCNRKLIGARHFVAGYGAGHVAADSFLSPRDDDGHGTHTASTAAGNFGVDPAIDGAGLGVTDISGIAPRARVAAYKVCWVGGDRTDGCANSDAVAAIDAAVRDGVDVINYSIGGSASNVIDAVSYAFLGASNAGVFVANSAGNGGPGASTVATPTTVPWLTSVAADEPARTFAATATITPSAGEPFSVTGASVTGGSPVAPLVDAVTIPAAGATATQAELCQDGALDPARAAGAIVICRRGSNDRVNKSRNVRAAGGTGMVLYNANDTQDTNTDTHWVPSVHVDLTAGTRVKAAAAAGATAQIGAGAAAPTTPRSIASFSARGPQTAVPAIAKPDLAAPGVNILAGMTPDPSDRTDQRPDTLFQAISGTSMASPHVAGAAALLKALHPLWTPAQIKSALMLTADSSLVRQDDTTPATPFDQGSGEVDPSAAARPGLVMDVTTGEYVRYVNALSPGVFGGADPLPASDLNLPSIAAPRVAGTFQTTRRFTSVDAEERRWAADVSVPGFDAQVSTGTGGFTTAAVEAGGTLELTVTFTRTTAALNEWAFGELTLSSGTTRLRLPVSLRPIAVAAPATVTATAPASAGSQPVALRVGTGGGMTALGWGPAAPSLRAGETIATDADGAHDPNVPGDGVKVYDVTVPEGAQLVSGRISAVDGGAAGGDLDLYAYRDADGDGSFASGELVARAATSAAAESLTQVAPAAGAYRFVVVGYRTLAPSRYDFSTWVVADPAPDDPAGGPGLSVGDALPGPTGRTAEVSLDWSGLDEPGLYLGVASYHDVGDLVPSPSSALATSVVEITRSAS